MEYLRGGELFGYIRKSKSINEKRISEIMKNIFYGVNYMHQNNIVHRDIKPENILFTEKGIPKIADFGTSSILNPLKKLKASYGTPYYIAPEVLKGNYDSKCDVWSCGVVLYMLLSGVPPFKGFSK